MSMLVLSTRTLHQATARLPSRRHLAMHARRVAPAPGPGIAAARRLHRLAPPRLHPLAPPRLSVRCLASKSDGDKSWGEIAAEAAGLGRQVPIPIWGDQLACASAPCCSSCPADWERLPCLPWSLPCRDLVKKVGKSVSEVASKAVEALAPSEEKQERVARRESERRQREEIYRPGGGARREGRRDACMQGAERRSVCCPTTPTAAHCCDTCLSPPAEDAGFGGGLVGGLLGKAVGSMLRGAVGALGEQLREAQEQVADVQVRCRQPRRLQRAGDALACCRSAASPNPFPCPNSCPPQARAARVIESSSQLRQKLGGSVQVGAAFSQSSSTAIINGRTSRRVTLLMPVAGGGRVAQVGPQLCDLSVLPVAAVQLPCAVPGRAFAGGRRAATLHRRDAILLPASLPCLPCRRRCSMWRATPPPTS